MLVIVLSSNWERANESIAKKHKKKNQKLLSREKKKLKECHQLFFHCQHPQNLRNVGNYTGTRIQFLAGIIIQYSEFTSI